MLRIIVLLIAIGMATAQRERNFQQSPQGRPFPDPSSGITAYSFDNEGTGNFRWNYATQDGSQQDATGSLKKNPDPKAEHQDIQNIVGSFSYQTPEGKNVRVEYTGDEGGYRQRTIIN